MIRAIIFTFLFSVITSIGQVLWKIGLNNVGGFYVKEMNVFQNVWRILWSWHIILGFVAFMVATGIWFYLLSNYKISVIIPISSVSFIFSMIAGKYFFYEHISLYNWFGVVLIIIGVVFIANQT